MCNVYMQPCLRSTAARVFQRTARLRRQLGAITRLLPQSSEPRAHSVNRNYSTPATRETLGPPSRPQRHAVAGTPLRERRYRPRIAFPEPGQGIEAWISNLEVALPPHLRQGQSETNIDHEQYTVQDVAYYLVVAYNRANQQFNLLSYLALEQERWKAVSWIVNRLLDDSDPYERIVHTASSSPRLQWHTRKSWDELTRSAFGLRQARLTVTTPSLPSFVDFSPRLPDLGWSSIKGALGMVWRALGTIILSASKTDKDSGGELMPRVLEIIATLHERGIIPDAVYRPTLLDEPLVLQQPPTLHLLSNQILIALSDASWRAQESSNAIRSKATGLQYDFLGNPMPGTEYRSHVVQLRPEVWLELVLWSCLHGGWIEEGTSILESPPLGAPDSDWSLFNFDEELLQSQDTTAPKEVSFLSLFGWGATSKKFDVEKTLSSEVIVAYVEALVNTVRTGIGERGLAASEVLAKIKTLKAMLDKHNRGLGTMSWDTIAVRLLESQGVSIVKNPALMQDILSLAQPFARELKLVNTATGRERGASFAPYTFVPSAAVLGLLHETIRAHIRLGNGRGALQAFEELQAFTDANMKRSMEEFFAALKNDAESSRSNSYSLASLWRRNTSTHFTSSIPQLAASYPNFYPQIPKALVGALLDEATSMRAFDFAEWLLYSKDADGPTVSERDFADKNVAPAIIRYASAVRDKELLRRVIAEQSTRTGSGGEVVLAASVLKAFLESQIELRRWDSVERILGHLSDRADRVWDSSTFAVFARELIRSESDVGDVDDTPIRQARRIFGGLAQQQYGPPQGIPSTSTDSIDSILGFLSSFGTDWFEYCAALRPRTDPHPLSLSASTFHILLQGTIDAYGSLRAMSVWQQWSLPISNVTVSPLERDTKVNDRGVPKLQAVRPNRGHGYRLAERAVYVESPTEDHPPYVLYNKVAPSADIVRNIVRAARAERSAMSSEELESSREEYMDLAQQVITALNHLGSDAEDISSELEGLQL